MKKNFLPFALTVIALLSFGAGCNKDSNTNQASSGIEKKGVFASIKDAFDKSIALRCDYTDEDGEKTVAYIKNKRIYMESEPKQVGEDKMILIHGLVKDEKMYIWGDGNAKGLIFDFTQTQEEPAKMGEKEIKSTQDIIDKLEEKKDKCRPDSISDDKFELPSKIEFMTL